MAKSHAWNKGRRQKNCFLGIFPKLVVIKFVNAYGLHGLNNQIIKKT